MTVSFQEIHPIEIDAQWPQQPFHGFSLDSRKVETGQIFIALTSYSQPEKTRTFAEAALANGALAVISETELGVAMNGYALTCVSAWETGKNVICNKLM